MLVTGAGGFVGSAVVRRLVDLVGSGAAPTVAGEPVSRVVAAVRDPRRAARLDDVPDSAHWGRAACDVTDPAQVTQTLVAHRPAAVVDLALVRTGTTPGDRAGPEAPEHALRDLVGQSVRSGARFVHTSSSWVLPAGDALDETTEPDPRLPYARAKLRAEDDVAEIASGAGMPWLSLRLFPIFGRYEARTRLLPSLVRAVRAGRPVEVSAPGRVRDFTDVDAVADAYVAALGAATDAWDGTYHIGSGTPITLREFAVAAIGHLGDLSLVRTGHAAMPDGHLDRQVCDPGLARDRLGWSAPADPRPDIRTVADWWVDRLDQPTLERDPAPW